MWNARLIRCILKNTSMYSTVVAGSNDMNTKLCKTLSQFFKITKTYAKEQH